MIGLEFEIQSSNYKEDMSKNLLPATMVKEFALEKAKDVTSSNSNAIVIGADTIVVFGNEIIGKPLSADDAISTLQKFSGKKHKVITGYALIDTASNTVIIKTVETEGKFRNLENEEIEAYVATEEPLDKAGSYAIQARGAALIEWIKGDVYNVIGLPVSSLVEDLKQLGIEVFKQ